MTDRERSFTVLLALLHLSRAGLPSSSDRVAGRTGMSRPHATAAIARLTCAGFVSRGRLTLTGLAVAASLDETRARMTSLAA